MHHRHALDVRFQEFSRRLEFFQGSELRNMLYCNGTLSTSHVQDNTRFAILRGQKTKVFMMQKPWWLGGRVSTFNNVWQATMIEPGITTHTLTDILPVSDYIWLILIDTTSTVWWPKLRLQLRCQHKNEDSNSNHEKWSIAKNITKLAKRFLDQLGTWTEWTCRPHKASSSWSNPTECPLLCLSMPIYADLWLQPVLSISDYLRYVINPDSTLAATVWQCITSVALIWVALITPLQVGHILTGNLLNLFHWYLGISKTLNWFNKFNKWFVFVFSGWKHAEIEMIETCNGAVY